MKYQTNFSNREFYVLTEDDSGAIMYDFDVEVLKVEQGYVVKNNRTLAGHLKSIKGYSELYEKVNGVSSRLSFVQDVEDINRVLMSK